MSMGQTVQALGAGVFRRRPPATARVPARQCPPTGGPVPLRKSPASSRPLARQGGLSALPFLCLSERLWGRFWRARWKKRVFLVVFDLSPTATKKRNAVSACPFCDQRNRERRTRRQMRSCTLFNRPVSGKGFWVRSVRLEQGEIYLSIAARRRVPRAADAVVWLAASTIARIASGDIWLPWRPKSSSKRPFHAFGAAMGRRGPIQTGSPDS